MSQEVRHFRRRARVSFMLGAASRAGQEGRRAEVRVGVGLTVSLTFGWSDLECDRLRPAFAFDRADRAITSFEITTLPMRLLTAIPVYNEERAW